MEEIGGIRFDVEAGTGDSVKNIQDLAAALKAARDATTALANAGRSGTVNVKSIQDAKKAVEDLTKAYSAVPDRKLRTLFQDARGSQNFETIKHDLDGMRSAVKSTEDGFGRLGGSASQGLSQVTQGMSRSSSAANALANAINNVAVARRREEAAQHAVNAVQRSANRGESSASEVARAREDADRARATRIAAERAALFQAQGRPTEAQQAEIALANTPARPRGRPRKVLQQSDYDAVEALERTGAKERLTAAQEELRIQRQNDRKSLEAALAKGRSGVPLNMGPPNLPDLEEQARKRTAFHEKRDDSPEEEARYEADYWKQYNAVRHARAMEAQREAAKQLEADVQVETAAMMQAIMKADKARATALQRANPNVQATRQGNMRAYEAARTRALQTVGRRGRGDRSEEYMTSSEQWRANQPEEEEFKTPAPPKFSDRGVRQQPLPTRRLDYLSGEAFRRRAALKKAADEAAAERAQIDREQEQQAAAETDAARAAAAASQRSPAQTGRERYQAQLARNAQIRNQAMMLRSSAVARQAQSQSQIPPPLTDDERSAELARRSEIARQALLRNQPSRSNSIQPPSRGSGDEEAQLEKIKAQIRAQNELNAARARGAQGQQAATQGLGTPNARFLQSLQMSTGGSAGPGPAEAMARAFDDIAKSAARAQEELKGINFGDTMSPQAVEAAGQSLTKLTEQYHLAIEAEKAFSAAGPAQEATLKALYTAFSQAQIALRKLNEEEKRTTGRVSGQALRAARQEPPAPTTPPATSGPLQAGPSLRATAAAAGNQSVTPINRGAAINDEVAKQAAEDAAKLAAGLAQAAAEAAKVQEYLSKIKFDNSSVEAATKSLQEMAQRAAIVHAELLAVATPAEFKGLDTSAAQVNLDKLRAGVQRVIEAEEAAAKASGNAVSPEARARIQELVAAYARAQVQISQTSKAVQQAAKDFGVAVPGSASSRTRAGARDYAASATARGSVAEAPDDKAFGRASAAIEATATAMGNMGNAAGRASRQVQQLKESSNFSAKVTSGVDVKNSEFDRTIRELRGLQTKDAVNVVLNFKGNESVKQIERVSRAIDDLHGKETITLNFKGTGDQILHTMLQLEQAIDKANGKGVTIKVNADVKDVEAKTSKLFSGAFRGFVAGSNLGGGLLIGAQSGATVAGALGTAAAIGVLKVTEAMINGVKAGVQYNSQLQLATITFRQLTGSAALAEKAVQGLTELADKTPFSTEQTIQAGRSFITIDSGDVDAMLKHANLAAQLAVVSKKGFVEGFDDAQTAIREILGGQTDSFARLFDQSRSSLDALKAKGLAPDDLAQAAVRQAGGSKQLLDAFGKSGAGELSTFTSRMHELAGIVTKPMFDSMTRSLGELNAAMAANKETWNAWASGVGAAIGSIVGFATELGKILGRNIALLGALSPTPILKAINDKVGQVQGGDRSVKDYQERKAAEDQAAKHPPVSPADAASQAAIAAARKERSDQIAAAGIQEVKLVEIGRQLNSNQAAQAVITQSYNAQIQPLQQQLDILSRPFFSLQRRQNGINAERQDLKNMSVDAEAPVGLRAQAASLEVIQGHKKDIFELTNQQKDLEKDVADAQRTVAADAVARVVRAKQEEIIAAEEALKALEARIEKNRELRSAELDRVRAVQAAEKDARDQALQATQDRIRGAQQARQEAMEAARASIEASKEARTEAREARAEAQRAAHEERDIARENTQEQIRLRRQAVQDALDGIREIMEQEQREFDNAERGLDRQNAARQESYRARIQSLQDRDQAMTRKESGKTPAEKELEALEKADKIRQNALALEDATRAVGEARSSREWRDAKRNLDRVKEQQAVEAQKEALQEKATREREAIEKAQQKRQDEIQALTRKAQDEDRKYQQEKDKREEAFRQKREAEEKSLREAEKAEKQKQRQEDDAQRAQDKADKAADRAEDKANRELAKADREQDRAWDQQMKALEQANREKDRQEANEIKKIEEANRAADRAAQEALAAQERADRAKARDEDNQTQAAKKAIDDQQRALDRIQRDEDAKAAAVKEQQDKDALERAKQLKAIMDPLLACRLAVAKAEDTATKAWIAAASVKLDSQQDALDAMVAMLNLTCARLSVDTAERIDALTEAEKRKLAPLQLQLDLLNCQKVVAQEALDIANRAVERAGDAITALNNARTAQGLPSTDPDPFPSGGPVRGAYEGGKALFQAIVDGVLWGLDQQNIGGILTKVATWFANNVIIPAKKVLGIASPSTVFAEIACEVANGFIDGFNAKATEIVSAIIAPFNNVIDSFFPIHVQQYTAIGAVAAKNFVDGWNGPSESPPLSSVGMALRAPFNYMIFDFFPNFEDKMWIRGAAAASMWEAGFDSSDIMTFMTIQFNNLLTLMQAYDPSFEAVGKSNAISWQNGFSACMEGFKFDCPACTPVEDTTQPPTGKPGNSQGTGGSHAESTGGLRSLRDAGAVVPSDMLAQSYTGQTDRSPTTNSSNNVTVNVTNHITASPGMDVETLSDMVTQKTVDFVINVLDHTQQASTTPVNTILPGAR